ncbi:unnamed protein product [Mytilus coruscus]|uniref:Myb/SANT-like DNA-binding domain-containing protein n=1 Tax=Mytilus coruscus TaxID=42192 RepID=A0A6J8CD56_MYTCO|nr:unnamed protein product [Mytilus coruscus]
MKTLERMEYISKMNMQTSHAALVYQIKKSRGINWTPSEKEYLLQLCSQRVGVIEDKKSDLLTLSKKAAAWKFIHNKFCARFGRKRTPIRIKEQWKRMKIAARAELRDRGIQPEVGANPVDPNVPTNKYYGETLDIISKVQEILFGKSQPSATINFENEDNETESMEVPFVIKTEPVDDVSSFVPGHSECSTQHGTSKFVSDDSLHDTDNSAMYLMYDRRPSNAYPHESTSPTNGPFNKRLDNSQHKILPQHGHPKITLKKSNIQSAVTIRNNSPPHEEVQQVEHLPSTREMNTSDHFQSGEGQLHIDKHLLEFARIEHERKMQIMEEEHLLQMEVLRMQRDIAAAKLKKANFKLTANSLNFS